jgi:hypothetical protein
MFALVTTFYYEKDVNRRNEFLRAIKYNVDNSQIVKIYILCESGEEFIAGIDSKILIIKQEQRPKFQDLIKVANALSSEVIRIIANTDLYFNETLAKANELKSKHVYCLTRWDLKSNGEIEFYPNFKSQDSWIFRDSLPENIGDYFMGLPGCDNRLAGELCESNFKITNPSFSIKSIHIHKTNKRTYNKYLDKVNGKYVYCLPIILKGEPKSKNINFLYFLLRRKYYSALIENRLFGVDLVVNNRIIAYFLLVYYKIRLKLNG